MDGKRKDAESSITDKGVVLGWLVYMGKDHAHEQQEECFSRWGRTMETFSLA